MLLWWKGEDMTDEMARKVDAEIANLIAETSKLNAQAAKLTQERQWYLLFVGAALTGAIAALTKLLL